MGSTTQHDSNGYSLAKAKSAINRRDWTAARIECEGLLNSHERSYFHHAEVWTLLAIAQIHLGKLEDAEHSYGTASALKGWNDQLDARYLRHLARYYSDQGQLPAVQHCLDLLEDLPGYDAGWGWMTMGRAAYALSLRRHTRGGRDEQLQIAIDCFRSADLYWRKEYGDVLDQYRMTNMQLWLTALLNQSHGYREPMAKELLDRIAKRDADLARKLKRKLHLARWGFKPH